MKKITALVRNQYDLLDNVGPPIAHSSAYPSSSESQLHAHIEILNMIRTAFLQSVRCASRAGISTRLSASRTTSSCFALAASRTPPAPKFQCARWYSAPAGLSKPEVEGRIMDLLKNFDKVRSRNILHLLHLGQTLKSPVT